MRRTSKSWHIGFGKTLLQKLRFAHGAWLGCEFSATIQTGKMYSQLIEAMHLLPQSFDMWATFLLPGSSLTRSAPLLLPGC
ncbi:hypothetical protein CN176_09540 [Sinorhizobium medicae]|nr:hypothetical protein CN176_09540 [Sinorhizobium medicae]